jgi:transcription initiation factor IIE alpha subunit
MAEMPKKATWTFLTNHAHVMACLLENPNMLMRRIADRVGITERAVQRIINELAESGYVTITKEGRQNTYVPNIAMPLRHPIESHKSVGELFSFLVPNLAATTIPSESKPDAG